MSIRLRFTLLYSGILALTLAIFGLGLHAIQAQSTLGALRQDVIRSSDRIAESILSTAFDPQSMSNPRPPKPFEDFSGEQVFKELPEREIVRILDASGNLLASPFGRSEETLPFSAEALEKVRDQQEVWETAEYNNQRMLIYSRPLVLDGQVAYILQVARPLTERDRSQDFLAVTFVVASAITILFAFGIGWVFSGYTFQPIHRLTQTARAIGDERDFTRRVDYTGPQDEVGELATTFNAMLGRLQDAYQQVAHSLEMQRDFVADVSHELRTPLTTLRGNLGLLRRQPPIPAEEQADILSDMVDESDRLIRLVNELLTLARADAGRALASDPVDILPVMEETCRQARQLDPSRTITLDAENIQVKGDRDAFKQVMLIALDNALKHSRGDVVVKTVRKGNQVEVSVSDSGDGIPPEILDHIFDRFYRGDESRLIPGFGLGLPIARALVEGMGGTITMESVAGQGSTLRVGMLSLKPQTPPKE